MTEYFENSLLNIKFFFKIVSNLFRIGNIISEYTTLKNERVVIYLIIEVKAKKLSI